LFERLKLDEILAARETVYFDYRNHSGFIFVREKAADENYLAGDSILRVINDFFCFLGTSDFDEVSIDKAWMEFLTYLNIILERTYLRYLNSSSPSSFFSADFWVKLQPFVHFDKSTVREQLEKRIHEFGSALLKILF
jgi:hypothetical protein